MMRWCGRKKCSVTMTSDYMVMVRYIPGIIFVKLLLTWELSLSHPKTTNKKK